MKRSVAWYKNWLKTPPRRLFSDGIKTRVKRWNQCGEVEAGWGGITLESNISFVSVYLQ
jgi:hypothetical protein